MGLCSVCGETYEPGGRWRADWCPECQSLNFDGCPELELDPPTDAETPPPRDVLITGTPGDVTVLHSALARMAARWREEVGAAMTLHAPFPYFGGKTRAAPLVWEALGNAPNYVEPFAGSLAVLLSRPHPPQLETVNDKDGFLCNFWRAVQLDPDAVAHYADQPSNECDLHARHSWLVPQRSSLTARLEGDPDYYDAKIAGWWCWGLCCWIGSGWCSGNGAWQVEGRQLVKTESTGGVRHKRPHLGNAGQGVQRQLPRLGDAGQGVQRQRPHLGNAGQGVQHRLPHLGQGGCGLGVHSLAARNDGLYAWMRALCERLRYVRVTCGDWTRVLGPSVTWKHGLTGVVLDPPYSHSERARDLYAVEADIAADVQAWCLANGDNPLLRIVLCGYSEEYTLPGWRVMPWKATAGYNGQNHARDNQNQQRERLWLSPACLEQQLPLFTCEYRRDLRLFWGAEP